MEKKISRKTESIVIAVLIALNISTVCIYLGVVYFENASLFMLYLSVALIFYLLSAKISTRKQSVVGGALLFGLGAVFVIWFNETMSPYAIFLLGFPLLFPATLLQPTYWEAILLLVPSLCLLIISAYLFKRYKWKWFFLGASLTSLAYAGWSLLQIAGLYYVNVGYALPDISIEGYSFPAIYTFKLFRSIFFATFFTILGYLEQMGILSKIVVGTHLVLTKIKKIIHGFVGGQKK